MNDKTTTVTLRPRVNEENLDSCTCKPCLVLIIHVESDMLLKCDAFDIHNLMDSQALFEIVSGKINKETEMENRHE